MERQKRIDDLEIVLNKKIKELNILAIAGGIGFVIIETALAIIQFWMIKGA